MKKFFLIFIIIFSLIGFVGCTQKDDTKSQFIKDFDIDIIHMSLAMKRCNYLERLNELVDYYKNRKVSE